MAIDRASRSVYVASWGAKTANNATELLQRLVATAPFMVHKGLTANGKAFTDRIGAGGERDMTGRHTWIAPALPTASPSG